MNKTFESEKPLVSVLIPLYNHEHFLEECLNSVRDEGWPNIELIIHDDQSPDNSYPLAKAWVDKNKGHFSKTVVEQAAKNRGVVGSLNRLLELATGDFIVCPLASDDALLPNSISARVAALQQRPDWLAVFGDAIAMDDDGNTLVNSYLSEHYNSVKENLLNDSKRRMEMLIRWTVPGPVILYRSEAFNPELGVGKYREDLYLEDRDMYLRLLRKNQLGFIDQPMARYRLHENNAMSDPSKKIPNMLARAEPLLEAAKQPSLDKWERFVSARLASALLAHVKRRQSQNPAARIGFAAIKIAHKTTAQLTAAMYLRSNTL